MLAFGKANGNWSWLIRRAAEQEKTAQFETTGIWDDVRSAWETKTGKKAPYARLPDIGVASPKMARARTNAWFATSVKRRYEACRAR